MLSSFHLNIIYTTHPIHILKGKCLNSIFFVYSLNHVLSKYYKILLLSRNYIYFKYNFPKLIYLHIYI